MTHTKCVAALRALDRRVYLLPLVALVHKRCLAHCAPASLLAVTRALDATRRWCLGEADVEECRAAADAVAGYAYAADAAAAAAAADAAAFAAFTANAYVDNAYVDAAAAHAAAADAAAAAAYTDAAAYAAAAGDAYATRQALVDACRGVEWTDAVTAGGHVRTRTHVWWREGELGGRWVPLAEVTPEQWVAFDVALEVT